jgi:hypothetical protein
MSDEITLTIPREREFLSVAHLVLGGVGVRLNLTFDILEDLQLALDAILERDREPGDITIALRVGMNTIEAAVGPLRDGVQSELARESGEEVGLRRILDTLVDSVEVESRGGASWVKLRKTVEDGQA